MSTRPTSQRGASKAKQDTENKPLANMPGWVWLLAGIAGGVLIATVFGIGSTDSKESPVAAVENSTGEQPAPVFDFYTLLPESEVTLAGSGETIKVPVEKQAGTPQTSPPKKQAVADNQPLSARYLLQAGSFRSIKDADRLKAQLTLWGLSPRVEKVSVGNNEFWHRVQLGPFDEKDALYSAQKTLAEHKVDSLLLKMK